MNKLMVDFATEALNVTGRFGRCAGVNIQGNLAARYELSEEGDSPFGSKDSFQLCCDSSGVDPLHRKLSRS